MSLFFICQKIPEFTIEIGVYHVVGARFLSGANFVDS